MVFVKRALPIVVMIFLFVLTSCNLSDSTNNQNTSSSYDIAFLSHDSYMVYDPRYEYIAVQIFFFSNLPNPDEKMQDLCLLNGNEMVLADGKASFNVFAADNSRYEGLVGWQISYEQEVPPKGNYQIDTVEFSINGMRYFANIGLIELDIIDTEEVTFDFRIGTYTSITYGLPHDERCFTFELTALVGDVTILGLDCGYLTSGMDISLRSMQSYATFDYSDDMNITKDQMRAFRVSCTANDARSLNLVVKPWVIYEYNGQERRMPLEGTIVLTLLLDEAVDAVMGNSFAVVV